MGQTDRPDDRRAAGSRLPSNSESAVKSNHETPKSGIPKRKKIEACPRLSCKIQYLLASNHSDQSTASEYFTDDQCVARASGALRATAKRLQSFGSRRVHSRSCRRRAK